MPIFASSESGVEYANDFEKAYPQAVKGLYPVVHASIETTFYHRRINRQGFDLEQLEKEIKNDLHGREDIRKIIDKVPDTNNNFGPHHAYFSVLDDLTKYILKHVAVHQEFPKIEDATGNLKPYRPHWIAIE